jgi:hypothetical protein
MRVNPACLARWSAAEARSGRRHSSRGDSRPAQEQWLQERTDRLREQRAEAYAGVLGRLREIDNYPAWVITGLAQGQVLAAEPMPTFEER